MASDHNQDNKGQPSHLGSSNSADRDSYDTENPETQYPQGAMNFGRYPYPFTSGLYIGGLQAQSHPTSSLSFHPFQFQWQSAGVVPTQIPVKPSIPTPELDYLPNSRVLLPSVAPDPLRKLLISVTWESDAGSLAVDTVKTQLANHEIRRKISRARVEEMAVPSLFDTAAGIFAKSMAEEKVHDLEALPPGVRSRVIWELEYIPYDFFRKMHIPEDNDENDIDEWVLRNEVWLRDVSATLGRQHDNVASKRLRGEDGVAIAQGAEKLDWRRGLVQLSAHADIVFPSSILTNTHRTITRPNSLRGFKILDGRRLAKLHMQPSVAMFAKIFEAMTDGLLKGLDWAHVFVAGGIVLGALLCTNHKDATNTPDQWKSSDVDLYIHGLGPADANKKIENIFEVFKANLPKGASVLVVRNAKTITFFSNYPRRRIQVVLKLVNSPKDVLLNFDLDHCAIGWDGNEVWMLPRAARALETGYTVFTMDLINGHYLGDRRETREQRVFKYADKGYGIRILPSYLRELQSVVNDSEKQKALGIAKTQTVPGSRQEQVWDLRDFQDLVDEARKWTAAVVMNAKLYSSVPTMSHAMLQEYPQNSEDPPSRSALSGLSLFMRHAALWEHEVAGDISYNDVPDYSWDENFTTKGFTENMDSFNNKERQGLVENLHQRFETEGYYSRYEAERILEKYLVKDIPTQRVTYADSVQDILKLDRDIYLPLWLPSQFIDFADDLIPQTVRSSGVPDYFVKPLIPGCKIEDSGNVRLVFWRITSITMWQLLNRTIDEVHEVLWSFHHANAAFHVEEGKRLNFLVSQLAKRAIRMTEQDEYGAFARWVARMPASVSTDYNPQFRDIGLEEEGDRIEGDYSQNPMRTWRNNEGAAMYSSTYE